MKMQSMVSRVDNTLDDGSICCMMVHPVSWPNHGPQIELSLASEALGLVRSLGWEIEKGPRYEQVCDSEEEAEKEMEEARREMEETEVSKEVQDDVMGTGGGRRR